MLCRECGTQNSENLLKCSNCNQILQLTNSPLSRGERVGVVIFFLLLASTIFFGVIPIIIALVYFFIMKNNKNFEPIIKSQKYIMYYMVILSLGAVIAVSVTNYNSETGYLMMKDSSVIEQELIIKKARAQTAMIAGLGLVLVPIAVGSLHWLFGVLYFRKLEKHQEWVVENGIFKSSLNNL